MSTNLPAAEIADQLNETLQKHNTVVVTAPPGAGKSTLLPLTMLQAFGQEGNILMLEPRRIATRQVATHMAATLGEQVGKTVGYTMRFEKRTGADTKLEVMTEGTLTTRLQQNPMLEGVSTVIFDEFHERNIATDVAWALARQLQQLLRPDLKLVIMSATLETESLCQKLDAPLITCSGRMYPVETIRAPRDRDTLDAESIARDMCSVIREAHSKHPGDILAFLPGQAEITRCAESLTGTLGNTCVFPLYGMLSQEQQKQAIVPSEPGSRKVVLATSIAETSLTIEGVQIVVDSGLGRHLVHDQRTGLSHLETVRISKDMATQRKGRAGRVSEGVCYQLWSSVQEHSMAECRMPELMDADLSQVVLDVLAWGADDVESLPWITPPPHAHVVKAREILTALGALQSGKGENPTNCWKLTALGKRMATLSSHPRISKMRIEAYTPELKALAADIAALLEERDPLQASENDADINTRLILLRQTRSRQQAGKWGQIVKVAEQHRKTMQVPEDNTVPDPYQVGWLLALAYPERIGRNTGYGHYRLSGGENANIDTADQLSAYDWIAIASLNATSGKVFLASPVHPEDLELEEFDNLSWNSKEGRVTAQHEQRIGKLVVSSKPMQQLKQEQVVEVIAKAAPKDGLSMFTFDEDVQMLQRRIAQVAAWQPAMELPDVSTEQVLVTAAEWLPLYIGKANSTSELRKIDMQQVIWGLLSYPQQLEVDRLAPATITLPGGGKPKRLQYRKGAEAPILSVRLQECFGLTDTPRVNQGQIPVLMELLSPGFKPVQLTSDLRSFWSGTYHEVRKELRRRYPKHNWPENPQDL